MWLGSKTDSPVLSVNCPYASLIAATILKTDFAWFVVLAIKHGTFVNLYAKLKIRTVIFFLQPIRKQPKRSYYGLLATWERA